MRMQNMRTVSFKITVGTGRSQSDIHGYIVDGKVIQELLSLRKIKSESLYFRPQHINLTSKDKLYLHVLVRPD